VLRAICGIGEWPCLRICIVGSYKAPSHASAASLNDLDSDDLWEFLADSQVLSPRLLANPEVRRLSETKCVVICDSPGGPPSVSLG